MAHKTARLIIGHMLTDEELRARLLKGPAETLSSLRDMGFDLTTAEIDAIARTMNGSGRWARNGLTHASSGAIWDQAGERRPNRCSLIEGGVSRRARVINPLDTIHDECH